MAEALNSQSEAARVMSVNTIVTSPSGGRASRCTIGGAADEFLDE
jgi:hypothetical protein